MHIMSVSMKFCFWKDISYQYVPLEVHAFLCAHTSHWLCLPQLAEFNLGTKVLS